MKTVVSVVSHGHDDMIVGNLQWERLNGLNDVEVVVKDNIRSNRLKSYCIDSGLQYLTSADTMGFGANNNDVFARVDLETGDWFFCVNPDIHIEIDDFRKLLGEIGSSSGPGRGFDIVGINLYRNAERTVSDDSIRNFPSFIDCVRSFLFRTGSHVKKSDVVGPVCVDWIAGSFLGFRSEVYRELSGFDTSYFMYYEDLDICYRARKRHGYSVVYFPNIAALHLVGNLSRRVFSKHFFWHVSSMCRYLSRARSWIRRP